MGRWTSPRVEEEPGRWARTGEEREDKAEQEGGEEADRGDKVWGEAVHKLEHWDCVQGWLGGRGRG